MRRILFSLVIFCGLLSSVGFAQELQPTNLPQTAEDIRQQLFQAQVALMNGDAATPQQAVSESQQVYETFLQADIARAAPAVDTRVQTYFQQAAASVEAQDVTAFAAQRSLIWTGLLAGSSEVVLAAVQEGAGDQAAAWLPLRVFRPATRFSRPGADATLALNDLRHNAQPVEEVTAAVRADLWDTYQGLLVRALGNADEAQANDFALRRAEEAGLAAGYFEIVAAAYGDQHGEPALEAARATFTALLTAAVTGDDRAFAAARSEIDAALDGFRAAPLSDIELARRGGQMIRFVALIPIEYGRGVRNGVVTNDIEIQEAHTFHEGATAALNDIYPVLAESDSQAAKRVQTLLDEVALQIREVVEPAALQTTIDEINTLLGQTMPPEWFDVTSDSDLDVIESVLNQVEQAVAQGDYTRAESARLEAYAILELGIEQRLNGFAPELAVHIENLFWQGTADRPGLVTLLAANAPLSEVKATRAALDTAFTESRRLLDSMRSAPAAVVGNAAIIVFREGLEAVLILASLLASMRTIEQRRFRRPLLVGAVLASAATVVTWWVATSLLNVLLPLGEKLEAIVSLIAIGVLLLITNWFFHKAYWVGWMANFHARKKRLVGGVVAISIGQSMGLVMLGFTSIYREGFETVLFLQSLVLEAGAAVVLQGVVLGLIGTAIVGVITFKLQVRLPYKKMLIVTGVMIGGVLLTMVGHTVHVMQSVGWLPVTPIPGVYLPFWMGQWFGVFATWQGVLLQVVAGGFVIGSFFLAEHQNKRKRSRVDASPAEQQALV